MSNAHRVGRRAVLGHLHLLRTVGSRAGLLGGVCTRMPKYKFMAMNIVTCYIKVIYSLLSVH